MSNVTPIEILHLTARVWGVTTAAMCKRRAGISAASPPKRATLAAVWLVCKHTETPMLELAHLLGYSAWAKGGDTRVMTLHRLAVECLAEVPVFAALVESVEERIDDLHDERESRMVIASAVRSEPTHA